MRNRAGVRPDWPQSSSVKIRRSGAESSKLRTSRRSMIRYMESSNDLPHGGPMWVQSVATPGSNEETGDSAPIATQGTRHAEHLGFSDERI